MLLIFGLSIIMEKTKVSGGYFDLNGTQIRSIPIPNATAEQQNKISSLVETILKKKRQDISADTSSLEQEIDRLVYELYGLTEEEVKVWSNDLLTKVKNRQ